MKIWFDMDGTIADLYGVENWLGYLMDSDTYPYENAKPMMNFSLFARQLNKVQSLGYEIGIISWTSKNGNEDYNCAVSVAKEKWLKKHLPSVQWNTINIVDYGTNKWAVCGNGILFDDEVRNRESWQGTSYAPEMIIKILKELIEKA